MESEENREQPTAANEEAQNKSLSKAKAIALLQSTIQQLESIVEDIDASQEIDLTLDTSINTLVTTTKELVATVTTSTPIAENPESVVSNSTPVPDKLESSLPTTDTTETTALPQPESEIPPPQATTTPPTQTARPKRKKPKRNQPLLIGSIASLVIVIAIAFWWFLPPQSTQLIFPQESTTTETEIEVTTDVIDTEDKEIEIAEKIENQQITPDTSLESDNTETDSDADQVLAIEIPSELVSPEEPKTIKLELVEPEIILTPEQSLIAAIQTRVTEITENYAEDLVISVQADFINSSLLVKVNDLWYELNETRQNKIANEILRRARKLDFQKLEIKDTQGILVARSPVVGTQAIILQKTQPSD